MEQIIVEMSSTATIAIAVFGIVFCLTQTKYSEVSKSLAAFLAAVAVNNVPDAFTRVLGKIPSVYAQPFEFVIWSPSSLLLAPLFWMYVFILTSPKQRRPKHLYRHLLLPVLSVFVGLIILVTQQDIWEILFSDAPLPTTVWPLTLVAAVLLLQLAVYPQLAFYLFLIIRRLMRYRLILRDFYASTEEHELRWIYVIGSLGVLFWLIAALILPIDVDSDQTETQSILFSIAGLSGLAMIATTTLWALRQHPPLVPDIEDKSTILIDNKNPRQPSEKYEKSALTAEASARITRKLRAAMEADHLHRPQCRPQEIPA
jgi:hypothetical protein